MQIHELCSIDQSSVYKPTCLLKPHKNEIQYEFINSYINDKENPDQSKKSSIILPCQP